MTTARPSNPSRECQRCFEIAERTVAHHAFGARVCIPCLTLIDRHLCVKCEDEVEETVDSAHLCNACAPPATLRDTEAAVDQLLGAGSLAPDESTDEDW